MSPDAYAMLIHDDGHPTHWDVAVPMLNEYDYSGVFAIITGRISNSEADRLRRFGKSGHEFHSHTVTHCNKSPNGRLTGLSSKAAREELKESKRDLEGWGFNYPTDAIVYPRGGVDDRIARIADYYYDIGFAGSTSRPIDGWTDRMRIPRASGHNVSSTIDAIERAGRSGGMVPIMLHAIRSPKSSDNDVTPTEYRRILNAIEDNHVEVLTPSEWVTIVR